MALSVVTPAFNAAPYIDATLDSVAALRTPHEHIVIDGGSPDGTADLLASRDDAALKWVSEPDRGQTHAVNKGLERVTGDLCAWLNADDAYNPEAVDRAVDLLARRPDVDVLYGGIQFTDERLERPPHIHTGRAELRPLPLLRRLHPHARPSSSGARSSRTRACSTSAGSTPRTTTSTCA